VLGYANWDAYCEAEFGSLRVRLPREERRDVVCSLREAGLSIRAIASATGIDKNTVQTDLAHVYEIHTPVKPVERAKEVLREDPSLSGFKVMVKAGVSEGTVRKARKQLAEETNPKPEPEPEPTLPPAVQDYEIVIKSDGTAFMKVTFCGDETPCEIPLNQGRLDPRITPEVAEHLANRLFHLPALIRELEKRLRHRAKPLPAGVSINV
ncbi:MAG: hypothetical protein WCE29_13610, partial [Mycobacterium sp.]